MKFGPDIWQSGRTQINKGEERGIGGRRGKGERGIKTNKQAGDLTPVLPRRQGNNNNP